MAISYQAKDAALLDAQLKFQEVVLPVTSPLLYVSAATTRLDISEEVLSAFVLGVDAAGANVESLATTLENGSVAVYNNAGVEVKAAISVTTADLAGFEYLIIRYVVA